MGNRRFVILDRDGTLIKERHYLSDPEGVELFSSTGPGLRALRRLGLGLCIVTNQSGVGRGYFDESSLGTVHRRLVALLAEEGVHLEAIYHCPHAPEERCLCRKPGTEMVERATEELGLDPTTSFVVGDSRIDMELGRRIGATTILVRTGYGTQVAAGSEVTPDHVVEDIGEASLIIQQIVRREMRSL